MNSEQKQQSAENRLHQALPQDVLPAGLAGVRVFVAEDEPMLMLVLEDVLTEMGCTVAGTATRVTEAIAFVTSQSCDVAVLDAKLADGGIEPVINALVARGTPFILATGLAKSSFAQGFGGSVFLQKPYTDAALRQALLAALAQGAAQR